MHVRPKEEKKEEKTDLQKKLEEEHKEEFDGWLNHSITKQIAESIKQDITVFEKKILANALVSGIDREVDHKKILAYSLEVRALKKVLKIFS